VYLDISLEPIDPIQQQAKLITLKEMWISKAISWENFAARSGIVDDISLERKLIEIEKVMADPAIAQILSQKMVQEWGIQERIDTINAMKTQKGIPENQGVYGQAATETDVNQMRSDIGEGGGMAPIEAQNVGAMV
jgi:hypothetical protein